MAIPGFQDITQPILSLLSDGQEWSPSVIRGAMATHFNLTAEELAELLPSGQQTTFVNRVAWALSYLKQFQLLESPRRGSYRIAERGRVVLAEGTARIDLAFLSRYPEYPGFRSPGHTQSEEPSVASHSAPEAQLTPDEQMRLGYSRLREALAAQLLERIGQGSPRFFEELVVDLLVKMGYGGSHEDAASVVGRGGDEGIDGIIKEDKLGLETIYVQAKRWAGTVGRPDVQRFAGALQGQRANKGVFITTSSYTAEAKAYVRTLQVTIVLIDGAYLAELMLDHGVGVSEVGVLRLWRMDEDYFVEE